MTSPYEPSRYLTLALTNAEVATLLRGGQVDVAVRDPANTTVVLVRDPQEMP